jgi:hypothetical protein
VIFCKHRAGSLAMLAAIRRASSFVMRLAEARRQHRSASISYGAELRPTGMRPSAHSITNTPHTTAKHPSASIDLSPPKSPFGPQWLLILVGMNLR